jgi:type I restriction enzyme M protein
MLDQTTKRKIDSARQILVGKVPDPKAQVEQITTALVYKFMDDMDKESEELGGEAKFFANGFSQYAWTKLLDNKLSGQERLDLYVQAITNMSKNPHIPQLFRDIFKGAFLPYNDPRTLSLFLKEINEFNYEHSENLGNAFEYLLSILGSQGDAGQFRTPRHIIDFIVEVVDPKKNETILDPACGTAGFLISAYKHILKTNKEKPLTPDEKLKLMNNLTGYDISPDMVKLALVNMYLHGFPEPKIHEYDTLSSEKRWDETFDVILANPPFMTPKGGINPHQRFSIQSSKAEILFVDYIIDHLNINGRAGIIVPEGIIFDTKAKSLRKKLIENDHLWAVLSLPQGVFNPYTDAKTNILFIDKQISKKHNDILFGEVLFDGFDLGLQRKAISKNDFPEFEKILKNRISGKNIYHPRIKLIKKKDISDNTNYDFFFGRYANSQNCRNYQNSISLRDILQRNKTQVEIDDSKKYKRVTIKMHGKGICLRDEISGSKIGTKKQFTIKKGQLLLSKIDARNGAFGIVPDELNGAIITGNFWAYDIKNDKSIDENYLNYLLFSDEFKKICNLSSAGVTNRRYLDENIFLDQKIPLPSFEKQKEIVREIQNKKAEISDYTNKIENLNRLWQY